MVHKLFPFFLFLFSFSLAVAQPRVVVDFNKDWRFFRGDTVKANENNFNDSKWRKLDLPHDWSIEGPFSEKNPATPNGGALPTGTGWYRKTFTLPETFSAKKVYINFDGVYRNSEVWINGHYLGKRPNGYTSFRYELTPFLLKRNNKNLIAVRVDNSAQPASRWYSGSGIYRKVWLEATGATAFDQWGVFVTTPHVTKEKATLQVKANINNTTGLKKHSLEVSVIDASGRVVATKRITEKILKDSLEVLSLNLSVVHPQLWSVDRPYCYLVRTRLYNDNKLVDEVQTTTGIRSFYFDPQKGFFLNGAPLKILGVCNHHDLGALGAAVNRRAIERQLEILKAMGCNAIRTAHNPPAQELLDLCDHMGFMVMDEAFDMWRKRKNREDYHLDFDEWSRRDLGDMVKRDRNHPSVFIWSIGNEIREQFDSTGTTIARMLTDVVKSFDTTRPVTSALTENNPEKNFIWQSDALDILGFNYKWPDYPLLPERFPGKAFLATETSSALATRGHYDMPSDSNRLWPPDGKTPYAKGNDDLTVSAYDHVYAYWGATHEAGWSAVKKYPFMSGIFVWSGFDFLGEPVPYPWPARSSYYGIIDLAGFPKDSYYMYQSEWTTKPVLHLFPHWNWERGKPVDVWAYYNNADEVELFLNGRSLGIKKKAGGALHVQWRVNFEPGTLRAVSRRNGRTMLTREVKTAGKPARIILEADRSVITTNHDLAFITAKIVDAEGTVVPNAGNDIQFSIIGKGYLAGTDNGLQTGMESFQSPNKKAFNGFCLAIVGGTAQGRIMVTARSPGLVAAFCQLLVKQENIASK
jgi:beta-galactosidase